MFCSMHIVFVYTTFLLHFSHLFFLSYQTHFYEVAKFKFIFYIFYKFNWKKIMLILSVCILLGLLFIFAPLRRNNFYMLHLLIVTAIVWYFETTYIPSRNISFLVANWQKFLGYFLLFHIVSINFVTFLAYGFDKRAAIRHGMRTPENQLHTLEFLGGWGGAIVAQRFFHHKNKKKEYQSFFWMLFIAELILIYVILKYINII